MRALHQKKYGDLSTYEVGDVPVPTAGSSEVLIRVHAASINPIDLKRSSLGIDDKETFPVVTGYDVAGLVESVGDAVRGFAKGDRVFGNVQADTVGPKTTGTVAEFCVARHDLLARVPDSVSMIDAAALPLVGQTAIQAFEMASVKATDKVFISAGAGGVGIHAMQIAKNMFGVSEVATTASAAKREFVVKYGADKVVDYKTEDAGAVLAGWADMVLDSTKESEMEKRVLKEGGKLVSIVDTGKEGVSFLLVIPRKKDLDKIAEAMKDDKLKAVVDTVYPLEDGVKAMKHVLDGRSKGKVVVQVCK